MKRTILFLLYLLVGIITHLNAQTSSSNSKRAIGVTYSGFGSNYAFYPEGLTGAGAYRGKGYYSLGVSYIHPISKRIDLETGVSYSNYTYQFSNASLSPDTSEPYDIKNAIIDIPLTLRWTFIRYFFINGGLLLGIDTRMDNSLDSQTGLGAMIGFGARYDFKNIPIGLFANSYYKRHKMGETALNKNHARTSENGFRFGVVYNLRQYATNMLDD